MATYIDEAPVGSVNGKESYNRVKELDTTKITEQEDVSRSSTRKALIILALAFLLSAFCLWLAYTNFPQLDREEVADFKLPSNIEQAKGLGKILSRYKDRYFFTVLGGFFMTYIFLQSFAIPGSIFLSILSGFLFSFPVALFLVCFCSALGASICYILSYLVGRRLVIKYFPEKVAHWSQHVKIHRSNLLNYIIFLRITPFLPNWFINISSPVIDVPLTPFFVGTFLGVAPPSFVAVRAGTTLHQLSSSGDALPWSSVLLLALFAIVAVLPVLFKKKLQSKLS